MPRERGTGYSFSNSFNPVGTRGGGRILAPGLFIRFYVCTFYTYIRHNICILFSAHAFFLLPIFYKYGDLILIDESNDFFMLMPACRSRFSWFKPFYYWHLWRSGEKWLCETCKTSFVNFSLSLSLSRFWFCVVPLNTDCFGLFSD